MIMTPYDDLYRDLRRYVRKVYLILLYPVAIRLKTKPTMRVERYEVFIRAYCLLVHAGIEEFVEEIAIKLLEETVQKWNGQQQANKITVLLLGEKRDQLTSKKREKILSDKHLTGLLSQARIAVEKDIRKNHGIKLENLYELFGPLGIEIDDSNPDWMSSLTNLANLRGEMAHKARIMTNLRPPNDYKEWVMNCLKLCDNIRDQANKLSAL
jgi:hypothetical protein